MNIQNHMHNAKRRLDLTRSCVEQHKYETALAMLADAWTNIRELIEHVSSLQRLKSEVEGPAGG